MLTRKLSASSALPSLTVQWARAGSTCEYRPNTRVCPEVVGSDVSLLISTRQALLYDRVPSISDESLVKEQEGSLSPSKRTPPSRLFQSSKELFPASLPRHRGSTLDASPTWGCY